MKKGSVKRTFDAFDVSMDNIERTILMTLHPPGAKDLLQRREQQAIVGGLALLFASEWEWLIRTLMVDLLNRDTTRFRAYTGFAVRKSLLWSECQAILEGTGYFDFRSVGDIKGKARQVLVDRHNAFNKIENSDADLIDDFLALRNYLAHQSSAARRSLTRVLEKNGIKTITSPSRFLMSRGRIWVYSVAFWEAEESMRRFLGVSPRSQGQDFYTFYQITEPSAEVLAAGAE